MTTPSTIHRRNARKRAKLRPPPRPLTAFERMLMQESLALLEKNMRVMESFSREYKR